MQTTEVDIGKKNWNRTNAVAYANGGLSLETQVAQLRRSYLPISQFLPRVHNNSIDKKPDIGVVPVRTLLS